MAQTTLTENKLLDIAWHYINQQNVEQAKLACQTLLAQYPQSDEGWFALSFLAFQLGDMKQALAHINQAIAIACQNERWLLHKAHILLVIKDKKSAKALLAQINLNLSKDIDFYAELALVFNKLSDHKKAEYYYQQAIALATRMAKAYQASLYFNLATMQRYLGKIAQANANLDKAIELNPQDSEAYLLRANLQKQTVDNNHILQIQTLLTKKQPLPPLSKAQLCYALAKEFEDIEQFQQSFHYLQQGATIRRNGISYDVKEDIATLKEIIKVFNHTCLTQTVEGCDDDRTIFILGLPRTGSTLVEHILASHSQVNTAGELNDFAIEMLRQCQNIQPFPPKNKLETVSLSARINFKALGQAYKERTQEYCAKGQYFIDKLPLNSLYIGLIHLALPNAKIIYVKRNPLDTCYAIYKQLFTQGYPFSYDLKELGEYFIAHYHLMAHWKKQLADKIYEIDYELLVINPADEINKLLEFCKLDWQQSCELFYQNNNASTTASASQVRQPIYQSSLHKWRNYQQQLAPLQQQLLLAGIPL